MLKCSVAAKGNLLDSMQNVQCINSILPTVSRPGWQWLSQPKRLQQCDATACSSFRVLPASADT